MVSRDGARIYFTGGTDSCGGGNYITGAYSNAGKKLWERQYNGPGRGQDSSSALALSPDGRRLYVTGKSWGGSVTHYDYATIAYNTGP